jgi:pimeloyl-ACP methyl ester carboxylesterase
MSEPQSRSYEDLFYQSEDGLTLYARDYPAPSADAQCVLLMHGLSRNSRDFEVLADHLSTHYRVLVAEQRGRGKSEWDSDPTRYAIPHYVRDMFALLQAANVSRVATVGTSMGGLMAMVMNSAMPGVFSHVVLNDIGPELCDEGLNRIKGYVGQGQPVTTWTEAVAYNRRINEVAFPTLSDEGWEQFARQIFKEIDGVPVLDYDPRISEAVNAEDSEAVPPDLWPVFDWLEQQPLMLIRGALSDLLDTRITAEMQRRVPAMVYLEVPDVGHAPMLKDEGVVAAIEAFFDR